MEWLAGEVGVGLGFGLWIVDGEGESLAELVTQKAWARRAQRGCVQASKGFYGLIARDMMTGGFGIGTGVGHYPGLVDTRKKGRMALS